MSAPLVVGLETSRRVVPNVALIFIPTCVNWDVITFYLG